MMCLSSDWALSLQSEAEGAERKGGGMSWGRSFWNMFHNTHLLQLLCPPQTNKRLITIRTRTKTVITEGVDYYQNRFEEGRKQIRGCKTAENTRNKAETWSRWKRWRSNWTIRHISPEMTLVRHFITKVTETWQMIRIIRRKIKNSKYF